jgi:hypothetical protein
MTHRSIAVPLVAVMIPFDKVQQHIYLYTLKIIIESIFSVCASCLEVEKSFHIREKTLAHLLFYSNSIFKMAHLPLVAYCGGG